MKSLSAYGIMQAWEWGQDKHMVDRALFLLTQAYPDAAYDNLCQLSVGQRNTRLLKLRAATFGQTINGVASCDQCGESLEFTITVTDLLLPEPTQEVFIIALEDMTVTYRLPNSVDLSKIVGLENAEAARQLLIERCVIKVAHGETAVSIQEVSPQMMHALADAISENDPQADMHFALVCPACEHNWSALFDVVAFFWVEIETRVKRLIDEVAVLAKAYSWREADILKMSATRRQYYLEKAT